MGDVTTRAGSRAAAGSAAASADRRALVRRSWPILAVPLAALLWWPVGFWGRAPWMHLPFLQGAGGVGHLSGGEVLLGSLVAAAVVAAVVSSPWPRFTTAAGLTALAWVLSDGDVTFAPGERPVLAGLAGIGLLLGLAVGSRAPRSPLAVATFLALVAGLSPASYPRGLMLAVAVALPFWSATADRVAPTVLAVVRVVVTWLVAVLVSVGLRSGFAALPPEGLADPMAAASTVARGAFDHLRTYGLEIAKAAPQMYTGWIWAAFAIAIALVVVARLVRARNARRAR